MKTIKTLVLIIIISLLSNNNYAQVSGFLGKKNIISGSLFMKSSFVMPNKNGKSGYFSFNDHYSIELERVINRRNSIKLHATSFESMYDLNSGNVYTVNNFNTFSTKSLGADFIFYRKSYIAPLGAYISGGFDVFFSDVNIDTVSTNPDYDNFFNSPKFTFNQTNTVHFGANIKSGVKQIFFNCISLDINFQMGCIFSKPKMPDDSIYSGIIASEEDIKTQIGTRLWGHYLWGVNCSLGFVF